MEFGQFCPIAKSMEIIGEKWTILILRELLMGSTRFNELQRGISMVSPAILTKRLNTLCDYELVIRKKLPGRKGYEYHPTSATKELLPIFIDLGNWGMRWTRQNLSDNDFDVDFLMTYLQRSIQVDKLPGKETIIKFQFTDLDKQPNWWIVVSGEIIDICTKLEKSADTVRLLIHQSDALSAEHRKHLETLTPSKGVYLDMIQPLIQGGQQR